jgi:imidazolonepropionase-like amidohydrolase
MTMSAMVLQRLSNVLEFVKEGVDLVKIMASGGGTRGTQNSEPSFSEELRAAVAEAHKFNRTTMAYCEAYESIGNAARAGVDVLEHCGFIMPDGSRGFDKESVEIMAKKKLFYNPTLQTGTSRLDSLKKKEKSGKSLSDEEKRTLLV